MNDNLGQTLNAYNDHIRRVEGYIREYEDKRVLEDFEQKLLKKYRLDLQQLHAQREMLIEERAQ